MARPKGAKQKQKIYNLPEFVEFKQPTPEFFNKETKMQFVDLRYGEFTSSIKAMEFAGNVSMHPAEKQARKLKVVQQVAASPEAKAKRKATMKERYGTEHALQNPELLKKARDKFDAQKDAIYTKQKQTVQARYNTDNVAKKFKACGEKNAMKNPKHLQKQKESVLNKYQSVGRLNTLNNGMYVSEYFKQITGSDNSQRANKIYNEYGADICEQWITTHKDSVSSLELKFADLVAHLSPERLNTKVHPDVNYRPDYKVGDLYVDVDGLLYHSERYKSDRKYHFIKRETYEKANLRLLQFHQDEIVFKGDIVKSIVENKVGIANNRYFARKLSIKEVDGVTSYSFFEENHLMGGVKSSKTLGLYDGDNLVMAIAYKTHKGITELNRVAGKKHTLVVGGLSKILNQIILREKCSIVVSFVDLRYGNGDSLLRTGFEYVHTTLGWSWTDGIRTYNRLQCRANMDHRRLSEAEYAEELGWYKIYDAGQAKFVKKITP